MTMISDNLQSVQARIHAACLACGRDPKTVRLLAVSKTFGADSVQAAIDAGQTAFGENYIQEAVEKIGAVRLWEQTQRAAPLALASEWHCVGPIQSNKTRLVAEHFDWVHSVDRLKIAQRLSEQRPANLAPLQVCLQVNVDGGTNKSGATPEEALPLALVVAALPGITLRGVMSIPEPTPDFVAQCPLFAGTAALFDQILSELRQFGTPQQVAAFDTLSMGMSADLEAAIHSGSTMVRVGTAIFGGRTQSRPR
jgi:pyridoxal phosphate enzyme (YggS family)